MLREKDFSNLDKVLEMRDDLFVVIADAIKHQIYRLKEEPTSTKASMLYLNILNETKTMVLQSRNLIKSQSYFLTNTNLADAVASKGGDMVVDSQSVRTTTAESASRQ